MRYSVAEYARLTGTSKAAVYKKMETSLKPYVEKEGRRCFLVFPDGVDVFNPSTSTFQPPFNPLSTPEGPISTPFQPCFNPETDQNPPDFNPVSTPREHGNNPETARKLPDFDPDHTPAAARVEVLEKEVEGLRGVLEAKEAHIADLTAEVARLTGELDRERIAGQELRQLMHQQQALTAKQIEATKRRPLLAAIFPRWYDRGQDHQEDGTT